MNNYIYTFAANIKANNNMTEEQLQKQVDELMNGRKGHQQARIVEIETEEHTRRGLLRGVQDGVLFFSWIPNLAKGVKSIEHLSMDVIKVLCEYEPKQILSIKRI